VYQTDGGVGWLTHKIERLQAHIERQNEAIRRAKQRHGEERAALRGLLRRVEWSSTNPVTLNIRCPVCFEERQGEYAVFWTHKPDCELHAALMGKQPDA
jgi:ribosomal protein L44E